jgi:excisionase family DNA binding protein
MSNRGAFPKTDSETRASSPERKSMSDKVYLSYKEAADFLGITVGTLYSLVSHKGIPHHRIGKRLVRFSKAELQRWLERKAIDDVRETGKEVA